MHECFPKHLRIVTERTKEDKDTIVGKQKRINMERIKWARNKEVPRPNNIRCCTFNFYVILIILE